MGVEPQFAKVAGFAAVTGSLLERVCLPFLEAAQNQDGGWGYRPGQRSGVEPTSWALMALGGAKSRKRLEAALGRGWRWLDETQLPDGSWPAFASQQTGCWVTSLACLALHLHGQSAERVAGGLAWLCSSRPGEGGLWWRLRNRLSRGSSLVRQDPSLVGWSWTPGTASWVEPTAHSLILLGALRSDLHPPNAAKRRELGEKMLYDRMCAGGGWNSGNPLVYGVAGEPRVIPTAWALLALARYADRDENHRSLEWLERNYKQIRGPASLALAHLCLRAYGRSMPSLETELSSYYQTNEFFHDTLVTAYVAVALGPPPRWITSAGSGSD
jgi:hypothetical protein